MRGLKNVKKWASVGAAGLALIALPAHAVYTVSIAQSGADVVATGSGTLNTAALTAGGGFVCSATGFIRASDATLCFSNGGTIYSGTTGPANFGSGGNNVGNSATGTGVTVQSGGTSLGLPAAYVSNSALSGTVTWTGKTISSLGLTPGTYTWTWGTGGTADSYVLTITAAPAPVAATVPTLSEYGLIALASLMAMGGIWAMRKRGQI